MSIGPGILLNDRYQVQAEVSAHPSESVFQALDLRMGRRVQVRVCPIPSPADTDGFFRLEQRAQALAALQQPNLQLCFDVGMLRRELFTVNEWLEGPSLAELVQNQPLPWPEARPILAQVCEGLRYAHEQGLHHLRLTSRCISIEAKGRVVVHSFPLAPEPDGLGEARDAKAFAALVAEALDLSNSPQALQELLKKADLRIGDFTETLEATPAAVAVAPRRLGRIAAGLVLAGTLGWGLHLIQAAPPSTLAIRTFTALDLDDPALANQLPEQLRQHLLRHPGLRLQPSDAKADLELHGRLAWEEVNRPLTLEGRLALKPPALLLTLSLWKRRGESPQWVQTRPMTEAGLRQLEQELDLQLTKELGQDSAAYGPKKVRLGTESPEAYQSLVRAKFFMVDRTKVGLQKAQRELEESIRWDPQFASAHAALAECWILQGLNLVVPIQEASLLARASAKRALAIDPNQAEVYCALAYARFRFDWDWKGAEPDFQKALTLDPQNSLIHHWYGFYLGCLGRWEESIKELKAAVDLDPIAFQAQINLAVVYSWSGDIDKSIAEFKRILEIQPKFLSCRARLVGELESRGRFRDSLAVQATFPAQGSEPVYGPAFQGLRSAYDRGGSEEYWQKRHKNLQSLVSLGLWDPWFLAYSLVNQGDFSGAFAVLNKAADDRSAYMVWTPKDPGLAPLRKDPRFKDLLRRINFPEE